MKRLEYKEVIKSYDIPSSLSNEFIVNGKLEKVYFWNNLIMWFSTNYVVVKGRIPLVLATSIWQKYPNNTYQIRVDGGSYDNNPREFAVDEKYEKEILSYREDLLSKIDANEYIRKCKDSLERLKKRSTYNKYVTCYHIDKKEGLNAFLSEYSKYINEKKEKEKENIINEVVKTLYKKL